MVKQAQVESESLPVKSKSKANRFDNFHEADASDRHSWPSDGVVYLGHLPHGFTEPEMREYFGQYGEVLGVKLARSRKTARSKGYGFVQFKYPEVASIAAETMKGYLLLGKVITAETLPANKRNPFSHSTSKIYRFVDWKKLFITKNNAPKTEKQTAHIVHNLLKNQDKRRQKLAQLGIEYNFPGFRGCIPVTGKPAKRRQKK